MNNESKNPTAKEAVKDQIASFLKSTERRISVMSEKMNEDYLNFFEWKADEMFKAQKRRAFFAQLLEAIDRKDDEMALSAWLLDIIARKSNEFVRGSLTRNSTNQMMNIAHLLNLESEQEIIRDLESLAHIAAYVER